MSRCTLLTPCCTSSRRILTETRNCRWLAVLWWSLLFSTSVSAQEHQQTFILQPGWNAVFVEVQPATTDPEVLWQGLPVDSAWTWNPRNSSVQFLRDPAEGLINNTSWLGYHDPTGTDSFLTNMSTIRGNRAYLINIGGTSAVTWSVSGTPLVVKQRWIPSSWNLVGGRIDPNGTTTFAQYFASEPALANQTIRRLASDGTWQTLPASSQMIAGEAFWIYADGATNFVSPFDVTPPERGMVDLGSDIAEGRLTLRNRTEQPQILSVAPRNAAQQLRYREYDFENLAYAWKEFPTSLEMTLLAGESRTLTVGIERANLTGTFSTILDIRDGDGSRRMVPVRAAANQARGSAGATPVGLWIGTVVVDAVAEVHGVDPLTPTGVPRPYEFRVLLHVDAEGTSKLLTHVTQMAELDDTGALVRLVLVTDDSSLSDFSGTALRDGRPAGRRVSTSAYDFAGDQLASSGGVGFGADLAFEIVRDEAEPTNPYRHKFHSEHQVGFSYVRTMDFHFTDTDPLGSDSGSRPDWLSTRFAGAYSEQISGLHDDPLRVSGTFSFQRVTDIEELDP